MSFNDVSEPKLKPLRVMIQFKSANRITNSKDLVWYLEQDIARLLISHYTVGKWFPLGEIPRGARASSDDGVLWQRLRGSQCNHLRQHLDCLIINRLSHAAGTIHREERFQCKHIAQWCMAVFFFIDSYTSEWYFSYIEDYTVTSIYEIDREFVNLISS